MNRWKYIFDFSLDIVNGSLHQRYIICNLLQHIAVVYGSLVLELG